MHASGAQAVELHGPFGAAPPRRRAPPRSPGCPAPSTAVNAALALASVHLLLHGPDPLVAAGAPVAAQALARAGRRAAGLPGRMQVVPRAGGRPVRPLAVVDYAHTPQAVAVALRALRPRTSGPLVVVLGAGGDRDPGKRGAMGAAAALEADVVVVTDDNPRSEDPAAHPCGRPRCSGRQRSRWAGPSPCLEVADRADAVAVRASGTHGAGAGGTLLVAGKGHETGQEVAGGHRRIPFDDREKRWPARRCAGWLAAARGSDRSDRPSTPPGPRRPSSGGRLVHGTPGPAGPAGPPLDRARATADSRAVRALGGLLRRAGPASSADGHRLRRPPPLARGAAAAVLAPASRPRRSTRPLAVVPDGVAALTTLAADSHARLRDAAAWHVVGVTGCVGQDHSRRTCWPRCCGPSAPTTGWWPAARLLQHRARGAGDRAGRRPWTRYLVSRWAPAERGTSPTWPGRPPRIGDVLNVGAAHVGEFGSREAIARGQGRARGGPAATDGRRGAQRRRRVVRAMATRTGARVLLVGRARCADVRADDIDLDAAGRPPSACSLPRARPR